MDLHMVLGSMVVDSTLAYKVLDSKLVLGMDRSMDYDRSSSQLAIKLLQPELVKMKIVSYENSC
jgi:hypothetical protein